MKRRTLLGLGGAMLAASGITGWTLTRNGGQPVLLSARDGNDGQHYAVKTVRGQVPLSRLAAAGETLEAYVGRKWLRPVWRISVTYD